MHWAAAAGYRGCALDAVRVLTELGTDPNAADENAETTRDIARRHSGAYLDRSTGWQPIHIACAHRWPVARRIALIR